MKTGGAGEYQRSAKAVRVGRKIVMNGEVHTVTAVATVEDPRLGTLVVITCGERVFRRPPDARVRIER